MQAGDAERANYVKYCVGSFYSAVVVAEEKKTVVAAAEKAVSRVVEVHRTLEEERERVEEHKAVDKHRPEVDTDCMQVEQEGEVGVAQPEEEADNAAEVAAAAAAIAGRRIRSLRTAQTAQEEVEVQGLARAAGLATEDCRQKRKPVALVLQPQRPSTQNNLAEPVEAAAVQEEEEAADRKSVV